MMNPGVTPTIIEQPPFGNFSIISPTRVIAPMVCSKGGEWRRLNERHGSQLPSRSVLC